MDKKDWCLAVLRKASANKSIGIQTTWTFEEVIDGLDDVEIGELVGGQRTHPVGGEMPSATVHRWKRDGEA